MSSNIKVHYVEEEFSRHIAYPQKDDKPIVMYIKFGEIEVGGRAYIIPRTHYATRNDLVAVTSTVLSYDPASGSFETLNTRYELEKLH